jgi:undecaprenyl-diphosphatase
VAHAFALLLVALGAAFWLDPIVYGWTSWWQSPALDALVGVVNPIGSGVTLLVVCMALTLLSGPRWPRLAEAGWLGALAFMVAGMTELGLKLLVGRPRPALGAGGVALAGSFIPTDLDSFPSGHATSVFAVATVVATFYPRLRLPLFMLAAAVALGRVYLGRHYVSDILAGALLGLVVATLVVRCRPGVLSFPGRRV